MRIEQHGEYLWQLTQWGMVNLYLVQEADGLTLIDCGMGGSEKGVLRAAAAIGQPIRRILLTHAHSDHAGGLDGVVAALPEAAVLLGERTAVFLNNPAARVPLPDEPQVKLRGGFVQSSVTATSSLCAGERVGSLRVVACPGHSPDQLAFFDEREGTLIAGDAFQTLGGVAVAGMLRWRFPLPAWATWHLPTALVSAVALRGLAPTRLAVGHGRVLAQPLAAMTAAIGAAQEVVNGQAQMA